MSNKKIFVGSSTESKKIAQTVSQYLAEADYVPLRWWHEFPPGSITIDRLSDVASEVDGAVFIFSEDDKLWYRNKELMTPRDNIFLEYGLFVKQLGRSRTLILKEKNAKLASDIQSITYERIIEDPHTVGERVVEHFNSIFLTFPEIKNDSLNIVVDPIVTEKQMNDKLPDEWQARSLYIGLEGAKNWLNVISEACYIPNQIELLKTGKIIEMLGTCSPRTLVSLGPGDGIVDREIAIYLRNKEPWLQYIPIDINEYLLYKSACLISEHVDVPTGIWSDFEDRTTFISKILNTYASHSILFSLIGGTLGNIEKYERRFFESYKSIMSGDDIFLLDIPIKSDSWSKEKDRRMKYEGFGIGQRRFLTYSIYLKTGENTEHIICDFENRIIFDSGHSDIPDTYTILIKDSKSKTALCQIRRYNFSEVANWLEKTLKVKILNMKEIFIDNHDIGKGIFLFKKKC